MVNLAGAEEIVEYYQEHGPSALWAPTLVDPIDPFRLDGYFTLLLGQQVPYRRQYTPTPQEQYVWQELQAEWATAAYNGLTVEEALKVVRSPQWQWTPGFYG